MFHSAALPIALLQLQGYCATHDKESKELQVAHDNRAITSTSLIPLSQPKQGSDFLNGKPQPGESLRFSCDRFYTGRHFQSFFTVHMQFHRHVLSLTSPSGCDLSQSPEGTTCYQAHCEHIVRVSAIFVTPPRKTEPTSGSSASRPSV